MKKEEPFFNCCSNTKTQDEVTYDFEPKTKVTDEKEAARLIAALTNQTIPQTDEMRFTYQGSDTKKSSIQDQKVTQAVSMIASSSRQNLQENK